MGLSQSLLNFLITLRIMNKSINPAFVKIIGPSNQSISGTIKLPGSKSISNRVLMIRSLCSNPFNILNISDSDDTEVLMSALSSDQYEINVHHAGTSFRFLTAYLALTGREALLTGSDRMKERPVGPLVDVLKSMGADIEYVEKDGFPPLRIGAMLGKVPAKVKLNAGVSSQYISALLMLAPTLPEGLDIELDGEIVSLPYITMTLKIMEFFGVSSFWEDRTIRIAPQNYVPHDYFVESDWSAASYYYAIAGLSDSAEIYIEGLQKNSLQGDAAISEIAEKFGVTTDYLENSIVIKKSSGASPLQFFEFDFIEQPDIVQSISVLAAGLGSHCIYSGLKTLRIKETDRIAALQEELSRFGVSLYAVPPRFSGKSGIEYYIQEGKATESKEAYCIKTYNDHRMAMAFAPLSLKFPICIQDPMVISKSYPSFWDDLEHLGFNVVFCDSQ